VPTPLSGYLLAANGWRKDGFTWKKHFDTIAYDGCDWMYWDFPNCVKDDNYGVDGLKIISRKIKNVEDLNDKK